LLLVVVDDDVVVDDVVVVVAVVVISLGQFELLTMSTLLILFQRFCSKNSKKIMIHIYKKNVEI